MSCTKIFCVCGSIVAFLNHLFQDAEMGDEHLVQISNVSSEEAVQLFEQVQLAVEQDWLERFGHFPRDFLDNCKIIFQLHSRENLVTVRGRRLSKEAIESGLFLLPL